MVVRKRGAHQEQHFEYDCENRLTRARTYRDGNLLSEGRYHYDSLGRRTAKAVQVDGTTTRTDFLWQGLRLLQEHRANGDSLYLYEPDSYAPLARVDRQGDDERVYYFHTDQIGTPLDVSDEDGQMVWQATYKAWGEVESYATEEIEQNLRFQGQYFDAETGLHYNTFRYYDPVVGRFVGQDPIGLNGGNNLYSYVSSPNGLIDPLGLASFPWGGDFESWFNNSTSSQIKEAMSDARISSGIKSALRGEGGMHEWFPVSMAAKAKEVGFSYGELMELTSSRADVYFENIPDPRNPGALLEGPHSTGKPLPAGQSGRASSIAHKILSEELGKVDSKPSAISAIKSFAGKYVRNGNKLTSGFSC